MGRRRWVWVGQSGRRPNDEILTKYSEDWRNYQRAFYQIDEWIGINQSRNLFLNSQSFCRKWISFAEYRTFCWKTNRWRALKMCNADKLIVMPEHATLAPPICRLAGEVLLSGRRVTQKGVLTVWPTEVNKGQGVKFCTVDCDSSFRPVDQRSFAGLPLTPDLCRPL